MADGTTYNYPTLGAVQAQITYPAGANTQSGAAAYGINANSVTPSYPTSAASYAVQLALDKAVVAAEAAGVILGTQFAWSDSTMTTPGTYNLPARDHVLQTGTAYYGVTGSLIDGLYSSTIVIDLEVSDVALEVA
jgi:hypothetical protein